MNIKIASLLLLGVVAATSCNKVESTLGVSDDISVSTLETKDTLSVAPNDTVRFRFLVSTSAGAIKNVDLEVDETVVKKLPAYSKFAIYDEANELTMDENGNLSRDISTVIVEYAVEVKDNPEIMNRSFKATLKATNQAGKTGVNFAYFKGNNTKTWKRSVQVMGGWSPQSTDKLFFAPNEYMGHSANEFIFKEDVEIGEDEIAKAEKVRNSIGMVVLFYNAGGNVYPYKLFSPDDEECEECLRSRVGIKTYDRTLMKSSVFYRINDVPEDEELEMQIAALGTDPKNNTEKLKLINQRRDNDYEYFDNLINEEYLKELDFSSASTSLDAKGGLYAFRLQDGRRGVIHLTYVGIYGAPQPLSINRGIVQLMNLNGPEENH